MDCHVGLQPPRKNEWESLFVAGLACPERVERAEAGQGSASRCYFDLLSGTSIRPHQPSQPKGKKQKQHTQTKQIALNWILGADVT